MAEAQTNKAKTLLTTEVKGILKHANETHDHPAVKWDEMNILETYHPSNKEYGHMKIDEPPTPYNYEFEIENENENPSESVEDVNVDPENIAERLKEASPRKDYHVIDKHDVDDEEYLTDETKVKKKEFRSHRKQHYNEFENVRKARELIAKELAEMDDGKDEMDTSK